MFTSFSTYFLIFWLCQIFKKKEVALLFMNWHFQSCFFRYDSKMCGWLRHDSNHRPENSVRIRTIQLHQDVLGPLGHLLSRRLSRSMFAVWLPLWPEMRLIPDSISCSTLNWSKYWAMNMSSKVIQHRSQISLSPECSHPCSWGGHWAYEGCVSSPHGPVASPKSLNLNAVGVVVRIKR